MSVQALTARVKTWRRSAPCNLPSPLRIAARSVWPAVVPTRCVHHITINRSMPFTVARVDNSSNCASASAPFSTAASVCIPRPCQVITLNEPFVTTRGVTLPKVSIRVECHGDPTLPPSRTVLIFPSFSHSSHCASNLADPSPGWWQEMVGPGKPIDTRHWRVICLGVLGSPYSPTNPTSTDPITGKQYRTRFPQLTPTDLARCHHAVVRQLGIHDPVHAVVGSSLGGMQVLQYASLYPSALSRCVVIAATGRTTPYTVAIRRLQRRAIMSDPGYHHGNYEDFKSGPSEGLRLAREIGTIFYRSREEFDSRFQWSPVGDTHFTAGDTWEVESYLSYAGRKFRQSYDANCYLLLSKCMDLMDLGDGVDGRHTFSDGAARIAAKALLIGVKQDTLIPPNELSMLADTINSARGAKDATATFMLMDSLYGHDAFLKEFEWLGQHVRKHLEDGLEEHLAAEMVHTTGLNAP